MIKVRKRNRLKSKNLFIAYLVTGGITILLTFFFLSYVIYTWDCYCCDTGTTVLNMKTALYAIPYISNPTFSVKLSLENVLHILRTHASLWWIYAVIALAFFMAASNRRDRDYHGIEKGSADWAGKADKKQFEDSTGIPVANQFYATVQNPKKCFYETHNLNEVVIGGSGAGKSFRKIKPDIINMFGSYVVTDPKGELYRDTAKLLKENGYTVLVLNLINISCTNSYNPFKYMREEQDVISIADLFMKNTAGEGEKEDFWSNSAKDLLIAIMIYLWKTEKETKTFGRALRLVNSISYDDGKVSGTCELARCMESHMIEYPCDAASINWLSVCGTPQETMGGIAKSLSTRLGMWAVHEIDHMTETDEMDFDNVGVKPTAIFLITPPARNPYRALVNMFYSQLFERLMYVANFKYNGRLPLLVSCELDEFANIGKIPNFDQTLAVVRSHNIRICIVLQGLSQLKALYEKTWQSIIGNCSIFTYLGTNDQETNEYIVKKLGKTTVRSESKSYNRGQSGGSTLQEHYDTRDLAELSELPQIYKVNQKNKKYGGDCIIFIDEFRPFSLHKFDTLNHPNIGKTGGPKHTENYTDILKEFAGKTEKEKRDGVELEKQPHSKVEQMMEIDYEKKCEEEQKRLKQQYEKNAVKKNIAETAPVPEEQEEIGEYEEVIDFDAVNHNF